MENGYIKQKQKQSKILYNIDVKNIGDFLTIGFTIIAVFFVAYLIGTKLDKLSLFLVIGAVFNLLYLFEHANKKSNAVIAIKTPTNFFFI